jgi:hypothetical protein
MYYGGTLLPLALFTGAIAAVMYAFFGYHFYLVVKNTTTNESYKWEDYARACAAHKRESEEKKPKNDEKNQGKMKQRKPKKKEEEQEEKPPTYKLDSKGRIVLKNIYNNGFVENFKEVLSFRFK